MLGGVAAASRYYVAVLKGHEPDEEKRGIRS
jgi:hypothetical protein